LHVFIKAFYMRLTEDEIRIAQLFSAVTGIDPTVVITGDAPHGRVALVVVPCTTGPLAVGKDGTNVKWVARLAKIASLIVVEDCGDPVQTFKQMFLGEGAEVSMTDGMLKIRVPEHAMGRAVGRNGWRANLARQLATLYGINTVKFEEVK